MYFFNSIKLYILIYSVYKNNKFVGLKQFATITSFYFKKIFPIYLFFVKCNLFILYKAVSI